jgi:putative membrane protein
MRRPWSRIGVAAVVALGAVTACKPKDRAADTTAAMTADTTAAAAGAAADTMSANVANNGWTDAQILAFAAAADSAEIAEGRLASTKGTNAQVKQFARQIVSDHQAMLKEWRQFASAHNITPDTTKNDIGDLRNDAREELKELTDKKAGADWDEEYLDNQVDDHKDVLGKLQDAAKATKDTALQAMLTKAAGKVQEHLTKAQALKEKSPS